MLTQIGNIDISCRFKIRIEIYFSMKLNPPEPKQLIHNMYFLQIQSPGGLFLKRKVITKQVTSYARYKNVMNNT